jgi:hypothetical protein
MIKWTRIPRQGFIAQHWVGRNEAGVEVCSIWKSPRWKHWQRDGKATYVRRPGSTSTQAFSSVAEAKAAAEQVIP